MKFRTRKSSKNLRTTSRGTLVIVSMLLIGSAVIRIGNGAGQAMALASQEPKKPATDTMTSHSACQTPEDLQSLLSAIRSRETKVAEREEALRDRVQALKIADREITKKLADLQSAEDSLRDTLALADGAAENDLTRLTKVYESMKPKQAALLFEKMDPNFAAGFLGRMRPEVAAQILAGLSPDSAHLFSVVLAGRNAEVPKE